MSKTIQQQIEVMQHYDNGGKIEVCFFGSHNWSDLTAEDYLFDFREYKYRIKEQKKTITIEKWLCSNEFGDYFAVEIGKNNVGECKKIKLIESYEVEL